MKRIKFKIVVATITHTNEHKQINIPTENSRRLRVWYRIYAVNQDWIIKRCRSLKVWKITNSPLEFCVYFCLKFFFHNHTPTPKNGQTWASVKICMNWISPDRNLDEIQIQLHLRCHPCVTFQECTHKQFNRHSTV